MFATERWFCWQHVPVLNAGQGLELLLMNRNWQSTWPHEAGVTILELEGHQTQSWLSHQDNCRTLKLVKAEPKSLKSRKMSSDSTMLVKTEDQSSGPSRGRRPVEHTKASVESPSPASVNYIPVASTTCHLFLQSL